MSFRRVLILAITFWASSAAAGDVTVTTLTAQFNGAGGVAVNDNGDIFVADFGQTLGGPPGTTVTQVDPVTGQLSVFANGLVGASGNAFDSQGNLFQSNISAGTVSKIDPQGNVSQFTGTGIVGPVGIAIDSADNVFVANCGNNTIRRVTPDGLTSTQFSADPRFSCPNGLTIDDNDTLYMANFNNGMVFSIDGAGVATLITQIPGFNNGHLTWANDRLYVVGRGANQIYEVLLDGTTTLLAGTGARGNLDGPADQATFSIPNGIDSGPDGRLLYINDAIPIAGANLNPVVLRVIDLGIEVEKEFEVNAGISGSWFDPLTNGQGWLLEVLTEPTDKADGLAVAYWFTFPPDSKGVAAEQAWIVGVGSIQGNTITFQDAQITSGGVFGPGFDPEAVQRSTWGDFLMTFDDCGNGTMSYVSKGGAFGSGELAMERITSVDGLDCETLAEGKRPAKVTEIDASFSGSWFDPDHDGEGWLIEILPGGIAVVYWFSYDGDGNQAWFVGVGSIEGKTITVDEVSIARGTVFGPGFDPGDVELVPWGSMEFTFDSCTTGTMSYVSTKGGEFGSGTLNLERITSLAGLPCAEPEEKIVTVTYMGNDGVMLDDGENQVLIDALERVTSGWVVFPPAELALVEGASVPYDRVAAALVTHNHGDHYSPASLAAFLGSNPTAQFIAPTQVGLTADPQNAGVFPGFGTSQAININGVDIEVLHLRHFNQFGNDFSNVQNYGYLVHMGGKKFLHLGDVDFATDNLAPFNLADRDIDVVFIPQFNTLISAANQAVIEDQIAPDQVVALHFQSTFVGTESAQVLGLWPDAIIFDTALETVEF